MPVMNGLEAAKAIRALPVKDAQTVPIVAMTANAFPEDIAATLQAGMNEHLSKPIDLEQFHSILQNGVSKFNKIVDNSTAIRYNIIVA